MFNRARIQLLESVRNEQAAKIKELEGKVHFLNPIGRQRLRDLSNVIH